MKLLGRAHWLVKLNYAAAVAVFMFTFAALQRIELAHEYAPMVWSIQFIGFNLVFALVALTAAAICTHLGFVVVSAVYCIMTHDKEMHWFPRIVVSAKVLIDRPRWAAEIGL